MIHTVDKLNREKERKEEKGRKRERDKERERRERKRESEQLNIVLNGSKWDWGNLNLDMRY